jgi:hypothetical protein
LSGLIPREPADCLFVWSRETKRGPGRCGMFEEILEARLAVYSDRVGNPSHIAVAEASAQLSTSGSSQPLGIEIGGSRLAPL